VALIYGAFAPFYYVEAPFNSAFLIFGLLNQGWFMGALFLLSGYFTPGSFDRKGPRSFLKDRLLRLGIPLIVFYFVLNPVSSVSTWYMPTELTGITTPLTWQAYPSLLGMGPMWFVAMLLTFDFGYVGWRMLTRNRTADSTGKSSPPSYLQIGIFILVLAAVSYLMRVVIPIGKYVLDFPTLAYLPQYLSFFMVGAVAYRGNWFRTLPVSMGWAGFAAAVMAGTVLFPLAFGGHFSGDGHWRSAVYALWDSTFAVGICVAGIVFFRRFLHRQGRFGRFLSQYSYTAYIIHIPIVVFLGVAFKGIALEPLLKFFVVAVIAVPACFVAAYLIRKIPGTSRIL